MVTAERHFPQHYLDLNAKRLVMGEPSPPLTLMINYRDQQLGRIECNLLDCTVSSLCNACMQVRGNGRLGRPLAQPKIDWSDLELRQQHVHKDGCLC